MICSTRQQGLNTAGGLKAVFQKDSLWEPGTNIKVEFINAPDWKKKWVEKVVTEQIAPYVNLTFEWDSAPGDISIDFPQAVIAQSMLGRTSRMERPSMSLGWLDPPFRSFEWQGKTYQIPAGQVRNETDQGPITTGATVAHEFGHALGMIHEHQNPFGEPIQWNEAAVFAYYSGPPNNWDSSAIRYNILDNVPKETHNGSAFDKDSIMIYSFPGYFTHNVPDGIKLPNQLSPTDKVWLSKMYPFDGYSCYGDKCSSGSDYKTLQECEEKCVNRYMSLKDCNGKYHCFYRGDKALELVNDDLCKGLKVIDACGSKDACLYNGYQLPPSVCQDGSFVKSQTIEDIICDKKLLRSEIRELAIQLQKAYNNGNETMVKTLTETMNEKRLMLGTCKTRIAESVGSSRILDVILAVGTMLVIYVIVWFIMSAKSKRPLSSRMDTASPLSNGY